MPTCSLKRSIAKIQSSQGHGCLLFIDICLGKVKETFENASHWDLKHCAVHSDKIIEDQEYHDVFLSLLRSMGDYIDANFGVRISGNCYQKPITVEISFAKLNRFSEDSDILVGANKYFDSNLPGEKKSKASESSNASESFVTSKVKFIVQSFGPATKSSTLRDYISEINKEYTSLWHSFADILAISDVHSMSMQKENISSAFDENVTNNSICNNVQ